MTSKIIHFNEGDVKVEQAECSNWQAWQSGNVWPVGYGATMLEAIADLNEKLND